MKWEVVEVIKFVWIGKLRVPRLLSASDGIGVPMQPSGWTSRSVTFQMATALFKSLILLALALSMLTGFWALSAFAAEEGKASWYSSADTCQFNPHPKCPMANGESIYDAEKRSEKFAASWRFPLGSKVTVVNRGNGKSVEVRITDRGPAKRLNRVIDLSKVAFAQIGALEKGLIDVEIRS